MLGVMNKCEYFYLLKFSYFGIFLIHVVISNEIDFICNLIYEQEHSKI